MLTLVYGIILLSFCYLNNATPFVIISSFGGVILLKVLITKITFTNNMNSEKVKKRIEKANSGKLVDHGLNVVGSLSTANPFFIAASLGRGIYSFFDDDDKTNRSVKTVDIKELSKVQNTSFNILFFGMVTDYVITLLVLMYPDTISTYLTDLFNSDIAKNAIEGISLGEDWK